MQKCLQVGMRVEAVQNERRPYINQQVKTDFLTSVLKRKPTDNSISHAIHPLTTLLNNYRDNSIQMATNEMKTQQQSTLHSILSSTSRAKSPTRMQKQRKRKIQFIDLSFSCLSFSAIIGLVLSIEYNN